MKKTNWMAGWGCGLLVLLAMLAINPRVAMGVNDDWSYIYSAKRLAETGHILYNGWATAVLGVQLYLGALFIRLFGFSFTAVRASSMLLGVLAAPLAHAVLMRFGIRSRHATLATLTLVLSPLYLPLATTFMSDAMATFFLLLFFYGCVRCADAETARTAMLWLVLATVAGLAAGSVRQIAWLSVLLALPCVAWQQRKRRGMLPAGLVLWAASLITVFALLHWFNHQAYVSVEKPYFRPRNLAQLQVFVARFGRSLVTLALLTAPVLLGLAMKFPLRQPGRRLQLGMVLAAVFVFVCAGTVFCGGAWWGTWLLGDYVSTSGVLYQPEVLGTPPQVVPPALQIVLIFALLATVAVCAAMLWLRPRTPRVKASSDDLLLWMAGPFTLAYLALVYTRAAVYDRYFLPLLFLAMLAALRWYEARFREDLSPLCLLPLAALALFGVAGTHDLFAASRARLAATDELLAAGVPRTEFHAGFDYDGWTQIEQTGYVNEPRLHPASAYQHYLIADELYAVHPSDVYKADWQNAPGLGGMCFTWFLSYTPSIHAHYVLESLPNYCFGDSGLPPVKYRTWLAPRDRAIYIAAIPQRFWDNVLIAAH